MCPLSNVCGLIVRAWINHAFVLQLLSSQDALDKGDFKGELSNVPRLSAIIVTAQEVAAGLAYLHKHNVVHGDLSAFNVLLTSSAATATAADRGFAVKLADFGEEGREIVRQYVLLMYAANDEGLKKLYHIALRCHVASRP